MKIDRRSFVPLYVQLKNIILRQIMSGDLAPGAILASETALCRMYGVSRITVRQALGDLEAEGLLRREPGRGTFITTATSKRGPSIGLLFGGLSERTFGHRNDESFGDLVRGAAEVASQRGAMVNPIPLLESDNLETALASPSIYQLNGLLVRIAREFTEDLLRPLDATGLPYVVIKRRLPEGRASCVYSDDRAAVAAMMAHLIGVGHRRIGFLFGPAEVGVWADRLAGYRDALEHHCMPVDETLIGQVGYPMDEASYQPALDLLRRSDRPTAIFAGNDYMAIGVYRAIRDLGLEPGRDVAVAGFGGTAFTTTMYPALTSVSMRGRRFGKAGAELLLDLITGVVRGPAQVVVPWELEIRPSTVGGTPPTGRPFSPSPDGVLRNKIAQT